MNSLCKTAKTLDTVVKIFKTLVIIACVASLIATALVGCMLLFDWEASIIGEAGTSLVLGTVRLSIAPDFDMPIETLLYHFLLDAAMVLAMSVFALIAVKYIRTILLPMTEGEPFRDVVAINLKKLAWLTVIYGVVQFFLSGLEAFLVNTFYSDTMNALVNGSHVTAITFETESDGLTFLIVAGVLFLLSYVFRYAQELQKLSDETL